MADSGVDTSNESSDNSVFDHPHFNLDCRLSFPCFTLPQAGPRDDAAPHDYVGKMKYSARERRHSRMKSFALFVTSTANRKLGIAAATNNVEAVEQLLKSGADPNSSDNQDRSPLHLAACRGYVEIVRLLLKYGANPNNKDSLGNTPLHLAACTSHIPVIIDLLDAGTDVTSLDRNGRNPIQLAQSKLKLIQMRPSGASHFEEAKHLIGEICLIVEMMLKYMKIQKADAGELESVRQRLEHISTREEVDNEVQCLLNSLNGLKLR